MQYLWQNDFDNIVKEVNWMNLKDDKFWNEPICRYTILYILSHIEGFIFSLFIYFSLFEPGAITTFLVSLRVGLEEILMYGSKWAYHLFNKYKGHFVHSVQ